MPSSTMSSLGEGRGIIGAVKSSSFLCPKLRFRGYVAVRFLIGFLLLTAGILKSYQLLFSSHTTNETWANIVWTPIELALACWLFSGRKTTIAWASAFATFASFMVYSFLSVIFGKRSCGCFGEIDVEPATALVIDIVCLALLLISRPHHTSGSLTNEIRCEHAKTRYVFSEHRFLRAFTILFCIVIGVGFGVALSGKGIDSFREPIRNDSAFTPDEWLGKPFPLLSSIDIEQIAIGEWTVLLLHHDCPRCQKVAARLANSQSNIASDCIRGRLAIVELPPYGNTSKEISYPTITFGRLDLPKPFTIPTPIILHTTNGIVNQINVPD